MTEDELAGCSEVGLVQESIDCLPNGFAILGRDFMPLHVNRTAREAFTDYYGAIERGLSYKEATFESVRAANPGLGEEEWWQMTEMREALLTSGKPADIVTPDGRIFNTVYRPMSGDRYVSIAVDVTEARRLTREVEQSRKAIEAVNLTRSAFLANISHEIRTPLNGILGMAQEVERGGLSERGQREHGDLICGFARTIKALFDDVVDIAKIDAGQVQLAPVEEDLHQFLAGQARLWRPLADEKLLDVKLTVSGQLPEHLRFDPARLGQCLSSLIGNAVKFTEKGQVCIKASPFTAPDGAGVGVAIEVQDTGAGMSPEALANLFVPFGHADSTFSRRFGGRGLGLVMTQKLAALMGGDLRIDSEPGKGTTATLTFLAQPAEGAARSRAAQRRDDSGGRRALYHTKKILLVDDHPLNRRVGKLYLEPEGFVLVEAVNGQHALDLLAEDHFDLVLMDIHMPVMDGLEALRQIRGSDAPWRDIPVIAFTADAMSGDREHYLAEGMNGYVLKPIEKRDLLIEITRVLDLPFEEAEPKPGASPALAATAQLHAPMR